MPIPRRRASSTHLRYFQFIFLSRWCYLILLWARWNFDCQWINRRAEPLGWSSLRSPKSHRILILWYYPSIRWYHLLLIFRWSPLNPLLWSRLTLSSIYHCRRRLAQGQPWKGRWLHPWGILCSRSIRWRAWTFRSWFCWYRCLACCKVRCSTQRQWILSHLCWSSLIGGS